MDIDDPVEHTRAEINLSDRSKELGVDKKFKDLLKAYNSKLSDINSSKNKFIALGNENITQFVSGDYPPMFCGPWKADDNGIWTVINNNCYRACYHPIIPIKRLVNLETKTEKIVIAYCRDNYQWQEITVDKEIISNNTKIVSLSAMGVAVTSETAKFLVKYLADVENGNKDIIPVQFSTAKMGWLRDGFMPYLDGIEFDGNGKFSDAFEAIRESGSFEAWLNLVLDIRKAGRIEAKMMLAASFASVIVGICGALPFWVNLWGETEGGKTVSLMLAASVWAEPSVGRYISDFKATDVALEMRMNFLNNLPMMIDDTATVKNKYKEDFSELIYTMCSGKGKSRSNRALGLNAEPTWKNVIMSTGEHPLSNENLQGGAINRLLDLEAGETAIYPDGKLVAGTLSLNYGFAGKMFVAAVKELGNEKVKEIQDNFHRKLQSADKMEKQAISLSVLLTADKIATDYIFKDGAYIDINEASQVLVDRESLSENERCYDYILNEVAANQNHFKENQLSDYLGEIWGCFEGEYVVIIKNIFDRICNSGGFSGKSFLSWAAKKEMIQSGSKRRVKQKRINGNNSWCVWLRKQKTVSDIEKPVDDDVPF